MLIFFSMDRRTSFSSGTLKMVEIPKCERVFFVGLFSFFSPLFLITAKADAWPGKCQPKWQKWKVTSN